MRNKNPKKVEGKEEKPKEIKLHSILVIDFHINLTFL